MSCCCCCLLCCAITNTASRHYTCWTRWQSLSDIVKPIGKYYQSSLSNRWLACRSWLDSMGCFNLCKIVSCDFNHQSKHIIIKIYDVVVLAAPAVRAHTLDWRRTQKCYWTICGNFWGWTTLSTPAPYSVLYVSSHLCESNAAPQQGTVSKPMLAQGGRTECFQTRCCTSFPLLKPQAGVATQ